MKKNVLNIFKKKLLENLRIYRNIYEREMSLLRNYYKLIGLQLYYFQFYFCLFINFIMFCLIYVREN